MSVEIKCFAFGSNDNEIMLPADVRSIPITFDNFLVYLNRVPGSRNYQRISYRTLDNPNPAASKIIPRVEGKKKEVKEDDTEERKL